MTHQIHSKSDIFSGFCSQHKQLIGNQFTSVLRMAADGRKCLLSFCII